MDAELRKEVRAFKVEVLDRLDRLEAALSAQSDAAMPEAGKPKKSSAEPAQTDKENV